MAASSAVNGLLKAQTLLLHNPHSVDSVKSEVHMHLPPSGCGPGLPPGAPSEAASAGLGLQATPVGGIVKADGASKSGVPECQLSAAGIGGTSLFVCGVGRSRDARAGPRETATLG